MKETKRIIAIDAMRALTMFFMLFVNDIPGLKGVPHGLFHAAADEDMLGFSDIIFPAFLFCVGLSVPHAIEARFSKGENHLQVLTHILTRTFSLICMGLLTLNCTAHGVLSASGFMLLMFVGVMLTWMIWPEGWVYRGLKWCGIALLIGLMVYSDASGKPFTTSWWGILGLIGWTYLTVSVIYLFTRRNVNRNCVVWLVVIALCILNSAQVFPSDYFTRHILLDFIPGGWTHHALGMSGVMASLWMWNMERQGRQRLMLQCFLGLGLSFLVIGFSCHSFWIISKIQATPTWMFLCLGIFFPLLAGIYWLMDMKGCTRWFSWFRPAGTATLTCYLMPYGWYALKGLFDLHVPGNIYYGAVGILLSLLFSFLIIQLVRLLLRWHIRLKV